MTIRRADRITFPCNDFHDFTAGVFIVHMGNGTKGDCIDD